MAMKIKLYIDASKERVAFAESESDFVDAIMSFLTMPMVTIVRLLNNNSQLGCFDNLSRSIRDLGESCFHSQAARDMLLSPVNSAWYLLWSLAVNLVSNEDPRPTKFYVCSNLEAHRSWTQYISRNRHSRCSCGSSMDREILVKGKTEVWCHDGLFVSTSLRYFITDDFHVDVVSTSRLLNLLKESGMEDADLGERVVTVGRKELLDLLGRFLISTTALTDVFLKRKTDANVASYKPCEAAAPPRGNETPTYYVKLIVNKDQNSVLYAEAQQNFSDLLSSFLSFPLGAILKLLNGKSSIVCADNLYKSIRNPRDLPFTTENGRKLLSPMLYQFHACRNQPISVSECQKEKYYLCQNAKCSNSFWLRSARGLDGNCPICKWKYPHSSEELHTNPDEKILRPTIVTEGLIMKPLSARSYIDSLNIVGGNLKDLRNAVEKTVQIGPTKALALLRASLVSKTPLSDALLK